MLYTVINYANKYHKSKSIRTVQRMIKSGLIPSNHHVEKGHDYMIYVDDYLPAAVEFHAKKTGIDNQLLATVLSVKYQIDKIKLFKFLGL